MADVFAGGTIVARGEGIEGIADAIHIIEEFTDLASPRFCAGERVVGDEIQAMRDVALQMDGKRFVTGAIVGAEDGDAGKIITPVAVHAGFESVVRAQNPVCAEGVLNTGGNVQCVGSMVIRIDQRGRAGSISDVEIVDGVEGLDPAVLREVVEKETDTAAQDRVSGRAGCVSDAEPRCEGFAVVVRNAGDNTVAGEGGIHALVVAGSDEEAKGAVVAQAVVDCQMRGDAPGVLGVNSKPLHILREAAIAGRDRRSAGETEIKEGGIGDVEAGIVRISQNGFGGGDEGAAENRLVNEVDTKARSVPAGSVTHVVAELIFFLIAQDGKSGDGSDELIVAEGFEAGNGAARGSKWEIEREAEIRIASGSEVQAAGVENERAEPVGIKRVLVAHNQVEVIAVRSRSGGGERGLLHQGVARDVTIRRSPEKPA